MKPLNRLHRLIEEFVQSENYRIRARIERLFEFADSRPRRNAGFEKWLQFELVLFFLRKQYEVEIEQIVWTDLRKGDRDLQIDILLKNHDIGIELKVRGSKRSAISAMKSDLAKFSRALDSHVNKTGNNFAVVLCGDPFDETDLQKLNGVSTDARCIAVGDRSFIIGQA